MFGKLKGLWGGYKKGSILKFELEDYRRLVELGIIDPSDEPKKKRVGRPPKDKMIKKSKNKAMSDT